MGRQLVVIFVLALMSVFDFLVTDDLSFKRTLSIFVPP